MNSEIAQQLLDIGAVVLSPNKPFTWTSGMKSPIYCDNRLTLSYPHIRRKITQAFVEIIREKFPEAEVIAGTATAGIPHAAWVSERMNLPMAYVRGNAKSHGKKKQIEGLIQAGQKAVVVEDLISTGGSSITAAEVLRREGADVLGVAAIFTYELDKADRAFEEAELPIYTITDFSTLLQMAHLSDEERARLKEWYKQPDSEEWLYAMKG
ncbi:MAG TPA: orotate phosphoribosyltransferase [Bacillales bacterium]|nr:orotate phosphoribosyltransferase [Bacillales bacterium]